MMSTRSKTVVVLTITLVIGMILGVLLGGFVQRRLFRKAVDRFRRPEGMAQAFERLIDVEPEQRETVMEILNRHALKTQELHLQMRELLEANMDSLKVELQSVLTEEQMSRFLERFENPRRFRDGPPPFKRGIRPPGRWRPRPKSDSTSSQQE